MPAKLPLASRYSVDSETQCWNWNGRLSKGGYALGTIQRVTRGVLRQSVAHRFYYEQANGPIPEGLQLDHLCRNRRCVNPAHLEPVTSRENRRRAAKLDRYDVLAIRDLAAAGVSQRDLAERFSLSQPYISRIVSGQRWSEQ